jgi:hypothetical protein
MYQQAVKNFMAQKDAMAVMAEEEGMDWSEFPEQSRAEYWYKQKGDWKNWLVPVETQYEWALEKFKAVPRGMPNNLGQIRASRKFSGKGAINALEGLEHKGIAGDTRREETDFGSGYRLDSKVSADILKSDSTASKGWGERSRNTVIPKVQTKYETAQIPPLTTRVQDTSEAEISARAEVFNDKKAKKVNVMVASDTRQISIPAVMAAHSKSQVLGSARKLDIMKSKTSVNADKALAKPIRDRERKNFSAVATIDAQKTLWKAGIAGGHNHISEIC